MSGQALSMKLTSMLECSLGHERSRSARTKACMLAWALPMLVGLELEERTQEVQVILRDQGLHHRRWAEIVQGP